MPEPSLHGRRILVVGHEYLLAEDISDALGSVGATALGPVGNVQDARTLIAGEPSIDAAVLDVNLRGDMVFPVADELRARGVPFASGYDKWVLPGRFAELRASKRRLRSTKWQQCWPSDHRVIEKAKRVPPQLRSV